MLIELLLFKNLQSDHILSSQFMELICASWLHSVVTALQICSESLQFCQLASVLFLVRFEDLEANGHRDWPRSFKRGTSDAHKHFGQGCCQYTLVGPRLSSVDFGWAKVVISGLWLGQGCCHWTLVGPRLSSVDFA